MRGPDRRQSLNQTVPEFLRRWWVLIVGFVAVVGSYTALVAEVKNKAERTEVLTIQAQLAAIQASMVLLQTSINDLRDRQREYYCTNKPIWCR